MRLIHVHTLKLKEFYGEFGVEIPEYAILSHTWEDEEYLFHDILQGNRTKKGFHKVQKFCTQAAADGYNWGWVDTCCIDKTASAELSEAINSMYTWYQKSAMCYAYLADVKSDAAFEQVLVDMAMDRRPGTSATSSRCRWFTRGWTLQELIAPVKIEFYGDNWKQLGSKDKHVYRLAAATGIDKTVLEGATPLSSISAAIRMSWASTRNTTRKEDQAYSLLGIFEVNMPLLYGEGHKAFLRLQEHIYRATEDHTIFMYGDVRPFDPDSPLPSTPRSPLAIRGPRDFATPCQFQSIMMENSGNARFLTDPISAEVGLRIDLPMTPILLGALRMNHMVKFGTMPGFDADRLRHQQFSLALFNVVPDMGLIGSGTLVYNVLEDVFTGYEAFKPSMRAAMLVRHSQFRQLGVQRVCNLGVYLLVEAWESDEWPITPCFMHVPPAASGWAPVPRMDWGYMMGEADDVGMGYARRILHFTKDLTPCGYCETKWVFLVSPGKQHIVACVRADYDTNKNTLHLTPAIGIVPPKMAKDEFTDDLMLHTHKLLQSSNNIDVSGLRDSQSVVRHDVVDQMTAVWAFTCWSAEVSISLRLQECEPAKG
ncbi:hypothetical protein S40293_07609 [Stachybotrys chartarum IBT 40293]|nr:hypothetical protein S40293_07609 [Stachybotrys chartarum IBT 40293]